MTHHGSITVRRSVANRRVGISHNAAEHVTPT
jgi:hypothetical protein